MKLCLSLNIPFVVPLFIVQDGSAAEGNAAMSVFGPTTKILMCWYHLVYNVKKWFKKAERGVDKLLQEMVIVDLTRLHYCLAHEFELFKAIVIAKWRSYPELADFVVYVIPQWFEGMFTNWQIFRSPPGFANTNNPLESFNKIIKAQFTNYNEQPILMFISIVLNHLIPYFSLSDKIFLFYRVPHKIVKKLAKQLVVSRFSPKSVVECTYLGFQHTHTINFTYKSCTCRWFMAFTVCAHLIAACDLYDQHLDGYTKKKRFVARPRRGVPKQALTFTRVAFTSNPMPLIATPDMLPVEDDRQSLFLVGTNNMPGYPTINDQESAAVHFVPPPPEEEVPRVKRKYTKKPTSTVRQSKRLQKEAIPAPSTSDAPAKRRGRPPKNKPALSVE